MGRLLVAALFLFVGCHAFSPFAAKSSTPSVVDDAVGIYKKAFPSRAKPRKRDFNASWGMPNRDIDGSKITVAKGSTMGKAFADLSDKELKATFQELGKIYGQNDALQMVKDVPLVLAARREYFRPSLSEFSKTFGEDEAVGMIKRNPGLLFVRPSDAAKADDLTNQFSYVVAATRPLGPFLLYGTLALLLVPVVQAVTGIPIQAKLLALLA